MSKLTASLPYTFTEIVNELNDRMRQYQFEEPYIYQDTWEDPYRWAAEEKHLVEMIAYYEESGYYKPVYREMLQVYRDFREEWPILDYIL